MIKSILFIFNPSSLKLRHVLLNDLCIKNIKVSCALPSEKIKDGKKLCPNVRFIPFEDFSGTSIGLLNNLKIILRMRKLLHQERSDAVFLGNIKPNIYGGWLASHSKIQHIYGLVSGLGYAFISDPSFKRSFVRYICLILYRLSFKHFSHVFFQNNDDRNLFIQKKIVNELNSSIIPGTGVDLQLFTQKPFPQILTFLMAARLIKEKGILHYVEAAKILKEKYPYVKFLLGGTIDTNPSALSHKQLHICKGIVDYIGFIENMAEALENCSIFVYPSYYREGIPCALLEAIACGRPIITTDSIGCRETVFHEQNGFKILPQNTASLAEAMEKFILNPSLINSMGKISRQHAKKFEIHKINKQIYQTIKAT